MKLFAFKPFAQLLNGSSSISIKIIIIIIISYKKSVNTKETFLIKDTDLEQHQNEMDLKHCFLVFFTNCFLDTQLFTFTDTFFCHFYQTKQGNINQIINDPYTKSAISE